MLGTTARLRGDWRRAVTLSEETVRISRDLDDGARVVAGLTALGWAWMDGGDPARSWESFDAALSLEEDDIDDEPQDSPVVWKGSGRSLATSELPRSGFA